MGPPVRPGRAGHPGLARREARERTPPRGLAIAGHGVGGGCRHVRGTGPLTRRGVPMPDNLLPFETTNTPTVGSIFETRFFRAASDAGLPGLHREEWATECVSLSVPD